MHAPRNDRINLFTHISTAGLLPDGTDSLFSLDKISKFAHALLLGITFIPSKKQLSNVSTKCPISIDILGPVFQAHKSMIIISDSTTNKRDM